MPRPRPRVRRQKGPRNPGAVECGQARDTAGRLRPVEGALVTGRAGPWSLLKMETFEGAQDKYGTPSPVLLR